MKKAFFSLFSFFLVGVVLSQQDPQFSQNMHNKLFTNPGVAGVNNQFCGTIINRTQWSGFDGAPKTLVFSGSAPVPVLHGGIGLSVALDALGQEKNTMAKAAYAYHVYTTSGTFGFGVGAGVINKSIGSDWRPPGVPSEQDPSIPSAGASDLAFDLEMGIYYRTSQLYVGLSATHLNAATLQGANQATNSINSFNFGVARHYYATAGYRHHLSPSLTLEPSVFVKTDAASAQIDLNSLLWFNQQFYAGITYRHQDAIAPMVGMALPLTNSTIKFGYSYDATSSSLRSYSSGSHEIMLGFCYSIIRTRITEYDNVRG